jgi:hypothetical protein
LWEGSYGTIPVPQYDHLKDLEKGWVAADAVNRAREYWDKNVETIEKWENESLWPEQ